MNVFGKALQIMIALIHKLAIKLLLLAFIGSSEANLPTSDIARADAAAIDMFNAFERVGVSDEEIEVLAPPVFVMSYFEAGWFADPKGNNDKGHACGVMQTHMPWIDIPGITCNDVRKDRVTGYEVGIRRIIRLRDKCGSLRAGLTAFATNEQCPKPGWTIKVILYRCKIAKC